MPYVAIPSQLKNVDSVSLELMSPEEMKNMSYGEVLTAETINYRSGTPQMNGLFCQAIFGPIKDWECACGKYKRYRYAGVICDKCGVMVTHSSVRRERMGHIALAAPCVHPWFLRIVSSRISLILDMKTIDISRVTYFSAYVITEINEDIRQEYLAKIERESIARVKQSKNDYDKKFEDLSRQYQIDKSLGKYDVDVLKSKYEVDKELLKNQQSEMHARIETISEVAKKELSALQYKDVITEVVYQELAQKFGPVFKAGIGAEAIETLLKNIDLAKEEEVLKLKLETSKGQNKKKIAKRLKLIKYFLNNNTRPEWMVLRCAMVLPPELRPMLQLDGGRFAASDLNELYRRLINRNNRLRKLIQIGAPEVILRNEKRMLQEAVEALIDNSAKSGRQVMASAGVKRPLKSLTDILKGKQGRFRQNLLGKRVDYSGRSVIIIGPHLKLDQCGIPKEMALELFKPFLIGKIIVKSEAGLLNDEGQAFNVHSARRLIESKKSVVYDILDEVIQDKYVLLNRAPTLHRLSFLAFKPILTEGKAIQLHPLVCRAFNADFDGDQMAVHLPITVKGQEEAKNLMVASKNLLKPASGDLIMGAHQDMILGGYYLTNVTKTPDAKDIKVFSSKNEALLSFDQKTIEIGELIKVRFGIGKEGKTIETTIGRIIFNACFPEENEYYNYTVDKKAFENILNTSYHNLGPEKLPKILDTLKYTTFKYVTESGISISFADLTSPTGKHELLAETREKIQQIQQYFEVGMMTADERYKQVVNTWRSTSEAISIMTQEQLDRSNNIGMMLTSGARGNNSLLNQMVGIRGLSVTASGHIIELPAQHGYIEGLSGLEYFIGMKGQRKAQADLSLKTADAGYLTRRLVDVAQNLIIMSEDCETKEYIIINEENSTRMNKSIWDRVYGRYLAKDATVDGKVIATAGSFVDIKMLETFKQAGVKELYARSSTKCALARGICKTCYGVDFSNHLPVKLGVPVGIIGAQSMGENSTQLTMDAKRSGGVLAKADITAGLPRVEELFEARMPKYSVPINTIDGVVEKLEGSVDLGFVITIAAKSAQHSLPYDATKDTLLVTEGAQVDDDDSLYIKSSGEIITSGVSGIFEAKGNEIILHQNTPIVREFKVLPGVGVNLTVGQTVKRGQLLAEGSADLQEIMDVSGIDAVQEYIINQLNDIYVANGISVNEKHIEVIVRQMCSKVSVVDAGGSDLTTGDTISLSLLRSINQQLLEQGKSAVSFKPTIIGISRASLSTDSFLSAASFQETARVLVEAVISGRKDYLLGLKENVILGQLIPAGTGFSTSKMNLANVVQEEFDEVPALEAESTEMAF
jgi:DNA-directed RNA polymerase subunit beta'